MYGGRVKPSLLGCCVFKDTIQDVKRGRGDVLQYGRTDGDGQTSNNGNGDGTGWDGYGDGYATAKRQKIGRKQTKATPHPIEKKSLSVHGSAHTTAI
jgi:hypothetical protein